MLCNFSYIFDAEHLIARFWDLPHFPKVSYYYYYYEKYLFFSFPVGFLSLTKMDENRVVRSRAP